MKYSIVLPFFFIAAMAVAQVEVTRIQPSEFPSSAYAAIEPYMANSRRVKFYRDNNGENPLYIVKFKKDRLKYRAAFNADSELKYAEFIISPVDIPDETYQNMMNSLANEFMKYKVREIRQTYNKPAQQETEILLKKAFQNLLLPTVKYKLLVRAKKEGPWTEYEMMYHSDGSLLQQPPDRS